MLKVLLASVIGFSVAFASGWTYDLKEDIVDSFVDSGLTYSQARCVMEEAARDFTPQQMYDAMGNGQWSDWLDNSGVVDRCAY